MRKPTNPNGDLPYLTCPRRKKTFLRRGLPNAWLGLTVAFFVFQSVPVTGRADVESGHQKRIILALFDSTEPFNGREDYNFVFRAGAMVLNYLGLEVKYYDIAKGVPAPDALEGVRGVLTWFDDEKMPRAEAYCHWAAEQIQQGRRYVILRNFGAFKDSETQKDVPLETINEVFHALDLEYRGNWSDNPLSIEIVEKDSSMVEFERPLENETEFYEQVLSLSPGNRTYLKLKRNDLSDSESHAVVVTARGGVVLGGYEIALDQVNDRLQWRIDPFRFFEEAFGLKGCPRYDTTTLFGRRIFYSHIDGDGVRNISEAEPRRFSGEVIYDEILKVYDLPITVSFITAGIDPFYLGSEKLVELARKILALENVEAGVHGFSHPLDWNKKITALVIPGYSIPLEEEADIASESAYDKGAYVTVDWESYLYQEIEGAADYINRALLTGGKKVKVNQWTGNCRPPAEAIDAVNRLGLKNINGGDTRFDRSIPSYTGVASLARYDQKRRQFFTSNANENIYTQGWKPPYDRFSQVIETFRETEKPTVVCSGPRRVTPMNAYYHFFSGERKGGLRALIRVYDYALTQDVIPVFTSEYLTVLEDFYRGNIDTRKDGSWEFRDYGTCSTVRFDGEKRFPDFERSSGIIGFKRWEDFLYVHLGDSGTAILYLGSAPPSVPYLKDASTLISEWKVSGKQISFRARGFEEGCYRVCNLGERASYEVRAERENGSGTKTFRKIIQANDQGELEIRIPVKGECRIRLVRS